MIQLDYRTNNRRWGLSGIMFTNWDNFAHALGFFSNIRHFRGYGQRGSMWDDTVSIHIENNDIDGADAKEGRIHWYKSRPQLNRFSPDLDHCSSGGTGNIIRRINSNAYIYSLISDFGFTRHGSSYIIDVMPPQNTQTVLFALQNELINQGVSHAEIQSCINNYNNGWSL